MIIFLYLWSDQNIKAPSNLSIWEEVLMTVPTCFSLSWNEGSLYHNQHGLIFYLLSHLRAMTIDCGFGGLLVSLLKIAQKYLSQHWDLHLITNVFYWKHHPKIEYLCLKPFLKEMYPVIRLQSCDLPWFFWWILSSVYHCSLQQQIFMPTID